MRPQLSAVKYSTAQLPETLSNKRFSHRSKSVTTLCEYRQMCLVLIEKPFLQTRLV